MEESESYKIAFKRAKNLLDDNTFSKLLGTKLTRIIVERESDIPPVILSRCSVSWNKNELAYKCKDCQTDNSCVVCVDCFKNADHKGHDCNTIKYSHQLATTLKLNFLGNLNRSANINSRRMLRLWRSRSMERVRIL